MRTAAALLLACASLPGPRAAAPAEPVVAEEPAVRSECFVLEDAQGRLQGTAIWRRRTGPRGVQLERELRFRDSDAPGAPESGVLLVECLERAGTRLVHREIGAGGRACLAELFSPGGLRAWEWGGCGTRAEVLSTQQSAALPLYLAELSRDGRFAAGRVGCFDPLAREVTELDVRTTFGAGTAGTAGLRARSVEMRRRDGTLFLRLEFSGTDLTSFQLQDGGPRARRVSAEELPHLRGGDPAVPGPGG
jgi:hypothetical protein